MDATIGLTFQLAALALIDGFVVKRLWRNTTNGSKKLLIAFGVIIASLMLLFGTMLLKF